MAGVGLALLISLGVLGASSAVDQTRQPGAVGSSVVDAVVNLIRESCLFADDKRFLRRLAYVQSHDGSDPKTYRHNYDGGIWQVDETDFLATKNKPSLQTSYNIIRDEFGINWNYVQWSDLRKPLYSGIAAALFTKLNGGVGWRVEDQAQFYQSHYFANAGNNFTNEANILDLGCRGNEELDLAFVIDSSNSLSSDDFTRAKYFISSVVDDFDIASDKTRLGVVTYSDTARTNIYLNSYFNKASLKNAIDNLPFNSGSTNTADAIDMAVNTIFTPGHGSRSHAVKVLIVVTDGVSNDRLNTEHAADRARASGIVVFSIGVGSNINSNELNYIATDPDCTHVFTVSGYDEIKAIKEEIQKSSCLAPVYINNTYSCQIEKCPPLAVLTGPGGVTLESNITCGLANVYTAYKNPYPSQSYYEELQQTSPSTPGALYRNSSTQQTLFINLVDALKGTTGSNGCVITITPYHGDHTDHKVKCYKDGHLIECPDNCEEKWNFPNPCTPKNIDDGKMKFPYPGDSEKYLMCDLAGKLYIVHCPQHETYFDLCQQCVGPDTPCTGGSGQTALNTSLANPCTAANILAGKFFFVYPPDKTYFIHCDVWGKPWVLSCPVGEEWDQSQLTCIRSSGIVSPCKNLGPDGPFFYQYPCDYSKYIRCDDHDQMFIMNCYTHYVFIPSAQKCLPRISYSPPVFSPGTVCPDGTTFGGGTVRPVVQFTPAPTSSNYGYTCCSNCSPFTAPCTNANMANSKFLFPIAGDLHHYIQCDLRGHMFCPRPCNVGVTGELDFFDPNTGTCVDGSVFVDPLLGK